MRRAPVGIAAASHMAGDVEQVLGGEGEARERAARRAGNRHPRPGQEGFGGEFHAATPRGLAYRRPGSRRRRERRRTAPWCRDVSGRRKSARLARSRRSRHARITAMRSQTCAATRRSWVMNSIERPSRRRISASRSQHLRLHRHVERRDRLVGDQHIGFQRERARDADALPLSAREFVRVAVRRRAGRGRPARAASGARQRLGRRDAVDDRPLGDDVRRRAGAGRASRRGPGTPSGCAADRAASRRGEQARDRFAVAG